MKLGLLFEKEAGLQSRFNIDKARGTPFEKRVKSIIKKRILEGESLLRAPVQMGSLSMNSIIYAIRHKKCVSAGAADLGSTYLENIIGNTIRDEFTGKTLNKARKVFGMEPIETKTPGEEQAKKRARLMSRFRPSR